MVDDGSIEPTPEIVRGVQAADRACATCRWSTRGSRVASTRVCALPARIWWPSRTPMTGRCRCGSSASSKCSNSRPDVAVVGCRMREVDAAGRELAPRTSFVAGDVNGALLHFNPIPNSCALVRRQRCSCCRRFRSAVPVRDGLRPVAPARRAWSGDHARRGACRQAHGGPPTSRRARSGLRLPKRFGSGSPRWAGAEVSRVSVGWRCRCSRLRRPGGQASCTALTWTGALAIGPLDALIDLGRAGQHPVGGQLVGDPRPAGRSQRGTTLGFAR